MEKERNISLKNKEVLISNGVKQALYVALKACVNPKDNVGIIEPYWLSYPALIEMNYGKIIKIKHKNFLPNLSDLEKKIHKLKVLIINNPNNPSGVLYDEEFLKKLALVLKKNPQIIIFSDEIYSDLVNDSFKNYYHYEPSLLENSIIFHGPSKSMAISGLRLGFAIASKSIIDSMTLVQSHVSSNVCHLLQDALKDYPVDQSFLNKVKIFLTDQRKSIKNILTKHKLKKLYYETDGAFYFLLSLKKLGIHDSSIDVAKKLADKNIYVTPSSLFGIEGFLRLSLSVSNTVLEEGLEGLLKELL
jgi:aspartate aminotransferase